MRSSPFTVTRATSVEWASPAGLGLGTTARKVAPFVGTDKAGCVFPCNKPAVSKTDNCAPFSVVNTKALSPDAKATCVGRPGKGIVVCGWNDFVWIFSSPVGAEMAFRTDSELVMASESGPAPTTMPLVGATAKSEQEGIGRASEGQGVGRS